MRVGVNADDEARALAATLKKIMECPLCLGYHTDPVRISDCCHTFCRSCLEGVFVATKGQAKCPSCKAKLTRRGFVTAVDTAEVVEVVKKLVLALDPMCITPPITQLLHEQNERGELGTETEASSSSSSSHPATGGTIVPVPALHVAQMEEETSGSIIVGVELHPPARAFKKGAKVHVDERCWVGMNKPGGAAKVVAVHDREDRGMATYDVKYVMGGQEKGVEHQYIHPIKELEPAQRRGRLSTSPPEKRGSRGIGRSGEADGVPTHPPSTTARDISENSIIMSSSSSSSSISNSTTPRSSNKRDLDKASASAPASTTSSAGRGENANKKSKAAGAHGVDENKPNAHVPNGTDHTFSVTPAVTPTAATGKIVLCASLSDMSKSDKKKMEESFAQLHQQFGVEVRDTVDESITHLIVHCKHGLVQKRSMKYLQSVVRGLWIVDSKWVSESVHAQEIQPEGRFEALYDRKTSSDARDNKGNICGRARTAKARGKRLFDGTVVVFAGQYPMPGPKKSELADLVVGAGGVVVEFRNLAAQRAEQKEKGSLIIVCPDTEAKDAYMEKYNVMDDGALNFVTPQYIIDSVGGFTLQSLTKYKPFSMHHKPSPFKR
jgi:hypothetical protein